MEILKQITENVLLGRADQNDQFIVEKMGLPGVKELTEEAINQGIDPNSILRDGLMAGMNIVGERFKKDEMFIPEVLNSAQAMGVGVKILQPRFVQGQERTTLAKFGIGTVQGDVHDIGKNLVAMMVEGAGFEVVNLGVDVSPDKFVDSVKHEGIEVLGLSALLTTTMPIIKTTLNALEKEGLRDHIKVIVGGAPITPEFAREVGADGYAPNAVTAVDEVKRLIQK